LAAATTGPKIQFDLGTNIASYIGAAILVGGLLTLMYLILGGISWITAGGDKGKVDKAREMITQAVVGLGVLAAAFAIFSVVQYFFGISIIGNGGGAATQQVQTSGGSTGGSGSTGSTCVVGTVANDGGSGGYCTNGGSALVRCVSAINGISYPHYEPCACLSGSKTRTFPLNDCNPTGRGGRNTTLPLP
jgi:hypothetical protein